MGSLRPPSSAYYFASVQGYAPLAPPVPCHAWRALCPEALELSSKHIQLPDEFKQGLGLARDVQIGPPDELQLNDFPWWDFRMVNMREG